MKKVLLFFLTFLIIISGSSVLASNESQEFMQKFSFNYNEEDEKLKVVLLLNESYADYEVLEKEGKVFKKLKQFNKRVSKALDLPSNSYQLEYAPFIQFEIDGLRDENLLVKELKNIAKSDYVIKIYVESYFELIEDAVVPRWGDYVKEHNYSNTTQYSGTGIDVGILETGFIDEEANELTNEPITYHNFSSSDLSEHATLVASIIAGDDGIVPDAELYNSTVSSDNLSDWESSFNWFLVTHDVDVINISLGIDTQGIYSALDEYLDYIITQHNTPVVKSAGNRGNTDGLITSPGLALNIITVGALEDESTLADYSSSVDIAGSNTEKPSLVALGTYKINCGLWCTTESSGTSYSAPAVTATIAAMMDRYSWIKNKPYIIHAVLTAYADRSNLTDYTNFTNGYEDEIGAGELSVYDSIMNVTKFITATVTSSHPVGISTVKYINLNAYDEITISLWWEVNSIYSSSTYNVQDTLNINLEIEHQLDGLYCSSSSSNHNFEKFTCTVYSTWTYDINVILAELLNTSNHGTSVSYAYSYKIE
jgi:hypothetical protein